MHEQAYNPSPESGDSTGQSSTDELGRLAAELSKWQARVPKLSAALRERTERVQFLENQLREIKGGSGESEANVEADSNDDARDGFIKELEEKVEELNSLYQGAKGQLHSGGLENDELLLEVGVWKEKWQSLTQSFEDATSLVDDQKTDLSDKTSELVALKSKLAEHATELEEKVHQIQMLSEEVESLNRRNENLFETTELANRQIETLGENLSALRDELRSKDQSTEAEASVLDEMKSNLETQTQKLLGKDEDIDELLV